MTGPPPPFVVETMKEEQEAASGMERPKMRETV